MSSGGTNMIEVSKSIYCVRQFYFEKLYYRARTSARAVDARIFHMLRVRYFSYIRQDLARAQYVEYSSVHSARGSARAAI